MEEKIKNTLDVLIEKRKNLTATIYEEEQLIELAKKLAPDELAKINPELLTYSNHKRLDSISSLLDKLLAKM